MISYTNWLRILILIIFVGVFAFITPAQEQTETPVPAIPLAFNETAIGVLHEAGDSVDYLFDVPADQDIVVAIEADRVVMPNYCVAITAPEHTDEVCTAMGGGGGDGPISRVLLLPAAEDPETEQAVTFTLYRPDLEGPASYQITAYPVTPQTVEPGELLDLAPDSAQPYQAYTLEIGPEQAFTVQIEDQAEDGDFLWAAFESYLPYLDERITFSEQRQNFPQDVDSAIRSDNPEGVSLLLVYYLGGDVFRVLVQSDGGYNMFIAPLELQTLEQGVPLTVTASYRTPIQALRLEAESNTVVMVNFNVVEGTGALAQVFGADDPYGKGLVLGYSSYTDHTYPATGTIEWPAETGGEVIITVQIPWEFTRSQISVQVDWSD